MPKQRPSAVLVLAILNFIYGGFAFCCFGCSAISLLSLPALSKAVPSTPGAPNPFADAEKVYQAAPGQYAVGIGITVLNLVMAVVLIVAGVGLLNLRPWGRKMSIAYGIYGIIFVLFSIVFQLVSANPEIAAMQAKQLEMFRNPMLEALANPIVGIAIRCVILLTYPIVLLIILFRPSIAAAFASESTPSLAEPPEYH